MILELDNKTLILILVSAFIGSFFNPLMLTGIIGAVICYIKRENILSQYPQILRFLDQIKTQLVRLYLHSVRVVKK